MVVDQFVHDSPGCFLSFSTIHVQTQKGFSANYDCYRARGTANICTGKTFLLKDKTFFSRTIERRHQGYIFVRIMAMNRRPFTPWEPFVPICFEKGMLCDDSTVVPGRCHVPRSSPIAEPERRVSRNNNVNRITYICGS